MDWSTAGTILLIYCNVSLWFQLRSVKAVNRKLEPLAKANAQPPDLARTFKADRIVLAYKKNEKYIDFGHIMYADIPIKQGNSSSIWHVLGMMPTTDRDLIHSSFRKMSLVYHPDCGGTTEAFNSLVAAKDKALEKCK